jgi:hypothetical protein
MFTLNSILRTKGAPVTLQSANANPGSANADTGPSKPNLPEPRRVRNYAVCKAEILEGQNTRECEQETRIRRASSELAALLTARAAL